MNPIEVAAADKKIWLLKVGQTTTAVVPVDKCAPNFPQSRDRDLTLRYRGSNQQLLCWTQVPTSVATVWRKACEQSMASTSIDDSDGVADLGVIRMLAPAPVGAWDTLDMNADLLCVWDRSLILFYPWTLIHSASLLYGERRIKKPCNFSSTLDHVSPGGHVLT